MKQKILDSDGNVPSREEQETKLSGSSLDRGLLMFYSSDWRWPGLLVQVLLLMLLAGVYVVGLVERDDFSSGSSSRSTKLLHGGVRFLEKAVFNLDYGQLKLVFHALEERNRIIQNAPHICRPLPTMMP